MKNTRFEGTFVDVINRVLDKFKKASNKGVQLSSIAVDCTDGRDSVVFKSTDHWFVVRAQDKDEIYYGGVRLPKIARCAPNLQPRNLPVTVNKFIKDDIAAHPEIMELLSEESKQHLGLAPKCPRTIKDVFPLLRLIDVEDRVMW